MFGIKRLKAKIWQLQRENEKLSSDNYKMKVKWEDQSVKTMTDAFFRLIGTGFDDIFIRLNKQDIRTIEIQTAMQTGDVDKCFVGMSYAVNVYLIDHIGVKDKVATVLVDSKGDGCFVSVVATKRRQCIYEYTKSISKFIQMQIEYLNMRIGATFEILQTEDVIDELLKTPEGNDEV